MISASDRELILASGKSIRRSRIEVIKDTSSAAGKRQGVDRDWPKAGEVVRATNPWTGDVHQVLVVENKRRKHGVEFETDSGVRFHSLSPLCEYLFGKRVSNGWSHCIWY